MTILTANEVRSFTEIKEMFKNRVIPIVRHFLATDELFESLDENQCIDLIVDVFIRNCFLDDLEKMDNETVTQKIKDLLETRVMFGLLSDLPPEQIAEYEQMLKEMRGK
jgi:Mg/Co/Ni transporter MgtE